MHIIPMSVFTTSMCDSPPTSGSDNSNNDDNNKSLESTLQTLGPGEQIHQHHDSHQERAQQQPQRYRQRSEARTATEQRYIVSSRRTSRVPDIGNWGAPVAIPRVRKRMAVTTATMPGQFPDEDENDGQLFELEAVEARTKGRQAARGVDDDDSNAQVIAGAEAGTDEIEMAKGPSEPDVDRVVDGKARDGHSAHISGEPKGQVTSKTGLGIQIPRDTEMEEVYYETSWSTSHAPGSNDLPAQDSESDASRRSFSPTRRPDSFASHYRRSYERRIRDESRRKKRRGVHGPLYGYPLPGEDVSIGTASVQRMIRIGPDHEQSVKRSEQRGNSTSPDEAPPRPSTPPRPTHLLLMSSSPLSTATAQSTPSPANADQTWHDLELRNLNSIRAAQHDLASPSVPPRLSSLNFLRTRRSKAPKPPAKSPRKPLFKFKSSPSKPAAPTSAPRPAPATPQASPPLNLAEFLADHPSPPLPSPAMFPAAAAAPSVAASSSATGRSKALPKLPRARLLKRAAAAALERQADAFIATSGGRGAVGARSAAQVPRQEGGGSLAESVVGVEGDGGRDGMVDGMGTTSGELEGAIAGLRDRDDEAEVRERDLRVRESATVEDWWGLQVMAALDEVREGVGAARKLSELDAGGSLGVSGKWRLSGVGQG